MAEEESLAAPLWSIRAAVALERSSEFRRAQLLAKVGRKRPAALGRRVWAWGATAAAVAALAFLLLRTPPVVQAPEAQSSSDELALAAFPDLSEESGFVPVPFAQPPAPGESVRVVREELDGVELAALGFDPPGGFAATFKADVVLGEDGMPRAVRLDGYEGF